MASYAHYALQKLRILPSVFMDMDQAEQAFIIASIDIRIEAEKESERKMKQKVKKHGRH